MGERQRRWLLGGGIGSGKSEVRRLLAAAGLETIDADSIGHAVLEPDGPAYPAVAARWPEVVVRGKVDRAHLAAIVFGDAEQLELLESITHPHIFGTIEGLVEQKDGAVVVEAPLLNSPTGGEWGRVVVDCPDEIRLERALARNMALEDVKARMSSQPSRGEWLAAADIVIPNAGSLADLELAVGEITRLL